MPFESLPSDPDLPQLEIAWDPQKMLELFRTALIPQSPRAVKIEACRLSRFRYRKSQRSIILYELDISSSHTKDITTLWVTGTTYKSKRAKRRYQQLSKIALKNPLLISGLTFVPVAYISVLKMLVQIFPMDRYLLSTPALLFDPPSEIHQLLCHAMGQEQNIDGVKWQIEPVRYRVGEGATLRYRAQLNSSYNGEDLNREFFVKIYREHAIDAFDSWHALYQHCEASKYRFRLARPIACLPKYQTVIIERAKGKPVDDILRSGQNISETMTIIAKALAEFHQSTLPCPPSNSREAALKRARKAGKMISWSCPHLADSVIEIINALTDRLVELGGCPRIA